MRLQLLDAGLAYFPPRRGTFNNFTQIVLTRVVVALKNSECLMARDRHDPLVVPAFPDFSRHKGMAEIMEMESG